MKTLTLSALALLTLAATAFAEPTPAERARSALALAGARAKRDYRRCTCGDSCACLAGECGSPFCPSLGLKAKKRKPILGPGKGTVVLLYARAYRMALSQGRPLCIWVGETSRSITDATEEAIHYETDNYNEDKTPRCIVSVPRNGAMVWSRTFQGIPALTDLRGAFSGPQPVPYVAPRRLFFQPVPLFMGGGFGGGCAGGSCGG